MTDTLPSHEDSIRAEAAAEERAAILAIIERYARQLAHGHGVTGAQVLEHIVHDVQRRAESSGGAERGTGSGS